jgi:O-antigen/teichoic acid export membrane protein
MFSGRIAVIGITFITGVIVARQLGPEGKGILTALAVYPTLIVSIAEMGVRQAAIYHLGKKIHDERDITATVMGLLCLTSLLGIAICAGIYAFVDNPNFTLPMIALALAGIPLSLATSMFQGILLGKERIGQFSAVSWLAQLLKLAAVLVFVWLLGWGILGEMLGSLLTGLVMTLYAFWLVTKSVQIGLSFSPRLSWELISLGFTYALALFVISLNYRVDVVILERFVSPADLGQYSLGVNLAELLWQLPAALGVVVFSRSANAKDAKAFSYSVAKLFRVTLVLALLGGLVLALCADLFIRVVYGAEFSPSANVVRLLLPGIVAFSLFKVLNVDLAGRGKPLISLFSVLPAVLLNIVLNFILVPPYGINGSAVASTLSYTVAVITYSVVYARTVEIPLAELVRYQKTDFDFISKILRRRP